MFWGIFILNGYIIFTFENTHIPYVIPQIFKTSDGQYGIAMEAADYDLINYFSPSPKTTESKTTEFYKKFTNENFKHNFKEVLFYPLKR